LQFTVIGFQLLAYYGLYHYSDFG